MARARIRTVKPEMLDDEKVAALPHLAWRLFVSLIMTSDDYGNQHGAVAKIRGTALWATDATDADIREALARLSRDSLVALYEVRGQAYVAICGWSKHQKVDKPGRPIVPGPEQADSQACGIRENLATNSREPRENLAPDQDQERDLDQEGKISHTAGAREVGNPKPRDRMLPLAEGLRCEVDTARTALLAELGAPFPPGSKPNDTAIRSTTLAIVVGWCASQPDRDPAVVVAERGKHLIAVRLAVARHRKRADWWSPSTFWDPDGIDKDLLHRTPEDAVRALGGQRPGHGARDSPRKPQPDPPRPPVSRL